jgi:hypothetical protein
LTVYSALCEKTAWLGGDFFYFNSVELGGIEGEYCSKNLSKGALIDESLNSVFIVGTNVSERQFLFGVLLGIIHGVRMLV